MCFIPLSFGILCYTLKDNKNNSFSILIARIIDVPINMSCAGGSVGQESTCHAGDAGDMGSIPGSGRSHGEGNGYPLEYFCLENPMDRGAWRDTVHEVAKSQT